MNNRKPYAHVKVVQFKEFHDNTDLISIQSLLPLTYEDNN